MKEGAIDGSLLEAITQILSTRPRPRPHPWQDIDG